MADRHALEATAYDPLPLGAIRPEGWLRRQLRVQADGITGHVEEYWPDLADNAWLGGERDGWERGPYYVDGLLPLAVLLDDDRLRDRAETWVEGFLDAQDDDGWIGPDTVEPPHDPDDPWPRFVVLKVLRQHYEATGDERSLDAIEAFARYLHDERDAWDIESWAAMRWQDLAVTLHWLAETRGESWPISLSVLAADRGYDWTDHFRQFRYPNPQPRDVHRGDEQMPTHVVNNAMGLKAPALRYRETGEADHRDAVAAGLSALDTFHGQVTGVFTGDEHLSGKRPTQGTELCGVVESMYSLEYLVGALGEASLADRLERVAYNALPATFTPDMWAHQYDQQVNQVLCSVADRPWTNDADANVFGQTPHYGCCQANFHQGWPKLAASLWLRTPDDGLAAAVYAPCRVSTTAGDTDVTVTTETNYPFGDDVTVRVDPETPVSFPLALRVPGWADDPTLVLPDGETASPEPGTFQRVEREWAAGDTVTLDTEPAVEAVRGYNGSVALRRGPLVFSLPVEAEERRLRGTPPHHDREFYPVEEWNYGLVVDTDDPAESVEVAVSSPGDTGSPFSPADPPVTLAVEGRRVPEWELDCGSAADVPSAPVRSAEPLVDLRLVPYGCTTLRVTEFPLLVE